MFEVLTVLIGIIVCGSALQTFARNRDPLAPMIIFAPMLLYVYSYHPLMFALSGEMPTYFGGNFMIDVVQLINLMCIAAFCLGLCWQRLPLQAARQLQQMARLDFTPRTRERLLHLGWLMALVAIGVFSSMLWVSGLSVFLQRKPFLLSPIQSGYYRELINLSCPAAFLMASAWQGRRLSAGKIVSILIALTPMFVMGTLGGRRGPLFLALATLGGCLWIIRQRQPNLRTVIAGLGMIGLLMIVLQFQRGFFRPWEVEERQVEAVGLFDRSVSAGDEFVVSSAMMMACLHHQRFYGGMRYIVQFIVRPIPRFLWPTKYEDCGMSWLVNAPGMAGFTESEWFDAVGFIPNAGAAGGFISDLFLDFHLAAILFAFLLGYLYSTVWKRSRLLGGFWTILYLEMLIVSVFLPSQSVGACLYRILLLAVPSWIVWKLVVRMRKPHRPPVAPPLLAQPSPWVEAVPPGSV